jgi:hypothetical protein
MNYKPKYETPKVGEPTIVESVKTTIVEDIAVKQIGLYGCNCNISTSVSVNPAQIQEKGGKFCF